jgi:hypothetical protein
MQRSHDTAADGCICEVAGMVAADSGLSSVPLEMFLRSGEERWAGAGSGRFSRGRD